MPKVFTEVPRSNIRAKNEICMKASLSKSLKGGVTLGDLVRDLYLSFLKQGLSSEHIADKVLKELQEKCTPADLFSQASLVFRHLVTTGTVVAFYSGTQAKEMAERLYQTASGRTTPVLFTLQDRWRPVFATEIRVNFAHESHKEWKEHMKCQYPDGVCCSLQGSVTSKIIATAFKLISGHPLPVPFIVNGRTKYSLKTH